MRRNISAFGINKEGSGIGSRSQKIIPDAVVKYLQILADTDHCCPINSDIFLIKILKMSHFKVRERLTKLFHVMCILR